MELQLKCKGVKTGTNSKGFPFLCLNFGDLIYGFVSKDDMDKFSGVRRGDYIDVEVLGFKNEKTGNIDIKFFPRDILLPPG